MALAASNAYTPLSYISGDSMVGLESQAIWVVVVGVRGSSSSTKYLCIFDERHCCLVRVINAAVLDVFPFKVA